MSAAQIRYLATDAQEDFLYRTEPYVLGSGGYASGKSSILAVSCGMYCMLNPGLDGMLVADTYGRLYRDFLPKLAKVLDDSGIEYTDIPARGGKKIPGWLIGPGNVDHRLLFASAKNPASLKGPTASHIHIEEATLLPPHIPGLDEPTFTILTSRLRATAQGFTPHNVIRASGTPESVGNWTMQPGVFWRPPVSRDAHEEWRRDFKVVTMSTWDAEHAGFIPRGFTQKQINLMTPDQVSEKILGIPKAGGAGRAYPEFVYERNVADVRFDRLLGDVWVGLDFNVNPMTACLAQNNRGVTQVFDEINLPHSTTFAMAREIIRRMAALRVPLDRVRVFPDASGRARRTSGESDFKVLKSCGLRWLTYPKSGNPPVSTRLNTVNAALYHRKLLVAPKCVGVIEDFEMTGVDSNGDLIKGPGRTHHTDGVGYIEIHVHPIRAGGAGLAVAA